MRALGSVYGAVAAWRRRWYAGSPSRSRALGRPVVSIGNLRVGGSGKTPVVAHIAQLLVERGERPSILSRGYGRSESPDGVTVVSSPAEVVGTLAESGDEPLMLARRLPGVPVLVCPDRFLAGRLAEREFDVTVHLLDDGFQHVRLARTVDLLLVDASDLDDHPLPHGRLREPLASASVADALLVTAEDESEADRVAEALRVATRFRVVRTLSPPVPLNRAHPDLPGSTSVYAFAGIARPGRFFAELFSSGWQVVGTRTFRDHHRYTQRDVDLMAAEARAAGAAFMLTTEKDAVRLERLDISALLLAYVPLTARVEPSTEFAGWLLDRLHAEPANVVPVASDAYRR